MAVLRISVIWLILFSAPLNAEDLYCKIEDKTVLTEFSDGTPDTVKLALGCTTIKKGQQLLKVEFDPVDDTKFKLLFQETGK